MNPKQLVPYEFNAKEHPERQIAKLAKSINDFGFLVPIVIDEKNHIAAGHGRWLAAKKLRLKKIPVVFAEDLTDEEINKFRLLDNELAKTGRDHGLLIKSLEEIGCADMRQEFQEFVVNEPTDAEYSEDDLDAFPNIDKMEIYVKEGQIFQLGDHRIMCGDCTNPENRKQLMNGEKRKADCIFTDPPYGISYTGNNAKDSKERDMIKNDDLRGDDLYKLLLGAFKCLHAFSQEKVAAYICYASRTHTIFETAIFDA